MKIYLPQLQLIKFQQNVKHQDSDNNDHGHVQKKLKKLFQIKHLNVHVSTLHTFLRYDWSDNDYDEDRDYEYVENGVYLTVHYNKEEFVVADDGVSLEDHNKGDTVDESENLDDNNSDNVNNSDAVDEGYIWVEGENVDDGDNVKERDNIFAFVHIFAAVRINVDHSDNGEYMDDKQDGNGDSSDYFGDNEDEEDADEKRKLH